MAGRFNPDRWDYEEQPAVRHRPRVRIEANAPPPQASIQVDPNTTPLASQKVWSALLGMIIAVVCISACLGPRLLPAPSNVPPDELPPHVKTYIDRAISRAMRDPVGRRDFALVADGARVVRALTGSVSVAGFSEEPPTMPLAAHPANVALADDLRIGSCWTISTAAGQLGIRLSERMYPTHVTVDHIPLEIAADISRAPRTMVLWGAVDGPGNIMRLQNFTHNVTIPTIRGRSGPHETANRTFIPLATFDYDIRSNSHIQTVPVLPYIIDMELYFGVVVLEVSSNWGGKTTCLYRVRVHGSVASL